MTTTINDEKKLVSIFGEKGTSLIKYLRILEKELPVYTYKFLSTIEYESLSTTNPKEGFRVFHLELLERAHWAAITTIYRSLGWISGITNSHISNNYLSFCATYRGFLESSADSYYSLSHIPISFAKLYKQIELFLKYEKPENLIVYEDLEDYLIHFSYGRNTKTGKREAAELGVELPDAHRAETMRTYLDKFGENNKVIHDCYSELCEVTHPGISSVWMYVANSDDNFGTVKIKNIFDNQLINDFCVRYPDLSYELIMTTFNLTMCTLRIVNAFNISEIKTPLIDKLSLDYIPVWKEIKEYIPNIT